MGRPARKKAYVESKAREKGRLQARVEMQKKKPLEVSLREHIGKMIDRIDPLETIAIFALTPIIEPFLENLAVAGAVSVNVVENWLKIWSFPFLGLPGGPTAEELEKKVGQGKIAMYMLAFVVAFILVRHGGEIAQAGINSLNGIVRLLGIGTVAA